MKIDRETARRVLATSMLKSDDIGAPTVCDYLVSLLAKLWEEGSDFSGKRPFGSSGWIWDLYLSLARGGFITVTVDEYGCLEDIESSQEDLAHKLIAAAIDELRVQPARDAYVSELEDLAELAWGVIANVGQGDWTTQTEEWRAAAVRWNSRWVSILMADQSTWPAHLRDDAPVQRCNRCGREAVSAEEFDTEDRMTQPDGNPCGGQFQ